MKIVKTQFGKAFLTSRREFFEDAQQLHINRTQAHPAFGVKGFVTRLAA